MVRTKPKSDKVLSIRLPEKDLIHLERYCCAQGRTKTDVLRQLIQGLPIIPAETEVSTAVLNTAPSRDERSC